MTLSLARGYGKKSDYDIDLEDAINTQLTSISADVTALQTAVSSLSGNITTLSGNITTLSGNVTALNDFVAVAESSAIFTLNLTTNRHFTITNTTNTSGKTLKIANVPTAADTFLNVNVLLVFSATATVTYTGTITWSLATAPNPTAAGTFILNLKSFNAGVNWLASYTGLY